MTDQERLISRPPHDETFFSDREFVYDPDSDWGTTRTGLIVLKEGELWIHQAPVILGHDWIVSPLREYQRAIGKHVLCNARTGLSKMTVDPAPWLKIQETVLLILRDSAGRRRLLAELIQTVRGIPELEKDLIEDTLRMMDSMGSGSVHVSGDKIWYGLAPIVHGFFDGIDYLSRFSDQLLAQSRQVDFLIRHSGTVGSFREELLRGFLRKVVPEKFRVSTGFIEDCARQLDIIVWDAINYAPLFGENEVVVVPRDSVRAIVEVKTKLDTNALDEALEILFEATARHPQVNLGFGKCRRSNQNRPVRVELKPATFLRLSRQRIFLQAVIGDWFGLVNGKTQIITTFQYVLDGQLVLFLICGARNERTIIKSKIQRPLRRGAKASSRSKRNIWGVARSSNGMKTALERSNRLVFA